MIVFAGPSVAGLDLPARLEFRPPAMQGDIYLAALEQPEAIGLIDGYFEGVPAVWHKEILWAMANGIPVLGASSMGALRAAELVHYGMIGIGEIFGGYRDGIYEDDDEVALFHAPREVGYAPLSIAMVNIRATMQAAIDQGVVNDEQASEIIHHSKALFYGDRIWTKILKDLDPALRAPLAVWLPDGEIDQKRRDAAALIERMIDGAPFEPNAAAAPYTFEVTRLWQSATRQWELAATARREAERGFRLLDGDEGGYSR